MNVVVLCGHCLASPLSRMISGAEERIILALDKPGKSVSVPLLAQSVIEKYLAARTPGDAKARGDLAARFPGIMSKLLRVMQAASYGSPYRFWLSSCIETFLR